MSEVQQTRESLIGRATLLRVLLRSFFVQAVTNYERMQNVGFAFCMSPALSKLFKGDALSAALERHLQFFNSHPYMTGALLGASIRMEEQVARGERTPQDVVMFKQVMQGPMAAIGDSFFWSSIRPCLAIWAVLGVLCDIWWAPFGFLLAFNLIHVVVRTYGVFVGYRDAENVCTRINDLSLVRLAQQSHWLSAVFAGICGAVIMDKAEGSSVNLGDGLEPFLILSLILIFILALKRAYSSLGLLYGASLTIVGVVFCLNTFFPVV